MVALVLASGSICIAKCPVNQFNFFHLGKYFLWTGINHSVPFPFQFACIAICQQNNIKTAVTAARIFPILKSP